jgi:hypothetical protein
MENASEVHKPMNSKGAAAFKIMLEDKRAVHEHVRKGGDIEDIRAEIKRHHDALKEFLNKGGKLDDFNYNLASF